MHLSFGGGNGPHIEERREKFANLEYGAELEWLAKQASRHNLSKPCGSVEKGLRPLGWNTIGLRATRRCGGRFPPPSRGCRRRIPPIGVRAIARVAFESNPIRIQPTRFVGVSRCTIDSCGIEGEVTMAETLLSPSNILLYGRVVSDLRVVHQGRSQHRRKGRRRDTQHVRISSGWEE
jgi:hypothetical protein